MNRENRNELLKTASLYAVLFIVTSMSTSALMAQPVAADTCGNRWAYYAEGDNTEVWNKSGVKAKSLITDLKQCVADDGSDNAVGSIVWLINPDYTILETGFFQGKKDDLNSPSTEHYFIGYRIGTGAITYIDVSDSTEINPVQGDWIYFSNFGNADTSNHYWHSRIEKVGSYTINTNDILLNTGVFDNSDVVLESRNQIPDKATAHFNNTMNGYFSGSTLYWTSWNSSQALPTSGNGLIAQKIAVDNYCMYKSGGSCP
jgi:hypothetical protein